MNAADSHTSIGEKAAFWAFICFPIALPAKWLFLAEKVIPNYEIAAWFGSVLGLVLLTFWHSFERYETAKKESDEEALLVANGGQFRSSDFTIEMTITVGLGNNIPVKIKNAEIRVPIIDKSVAPGWSNPYLRIGHELQSGPSGPMTRPDTATYAVRIAWAEFERMVFECDGYATVSVSTTTGTVKEYPFSIYWVYAPILLAVYPQREAMPTEQKQQLTAIERATKAEWSKEKLQTLHETTKNWIRSVREENTSKAAPPTTFDKP